MARGKLRLAYIVNQSKRKASYLKRKRGMFKKLNELIALCDINAASIMFSSFEQGPVIWPSVEEGHRMMVMFLNLPDEQQTRRMMSQETFIVGRIEKLSTQLLNLKKDNREREMNEWMHHIFIGEKTVDSLNYIELNDLGWVLNMNLTEIDKRVEVIMRDSSTPASSVLAPAPTLVPFLPGAPSLATASPTVFRPGPSNVVAPADVFSLQSYQGIASIQTPMSTNLNPGTAWGYQSWAFMNNSNQNDPTQRGSSGPSTSQNP